MKYALSILFVFFVFAAVGPAGANEIPAPPDVAKAPADASCTESGLCSKVLTAGEDNQHPDPWDKVTVHYTGWTTDGKMFDSSVARDLEASFLLNQVIAGWTEGLQLMVVGEKRRFWIPVDLAYKGRPGRPAGMLVFDIELFGIEDLEEPPAPPVAPKDVAAAPADAEKTASGLASKVLVAGSGSTHPGEGSRVTFHYSGWTTDGAMFDSSVVRGKPITVPLDQFIPGWQEGVKLMVVGEKRRLWIPAELGFGEASGSPQGMLVIDVELLEIEEMPKAPPAPAAVEAPPANAAKTASGLASKVVKEGTGTEHPTETSNVSVHYTGWTTDGKMFDSSVVRGEPTSFPLNRVIPGWTEGLQLMVVGEKRRFWIPEELAYKGSPGAPQGMLVFDVELLEIK